MGTKRNLGVILMLLCVVFVATAPAAEVSGIVTDVTGATLVGARIMLVDLTSLETKTAEIRENGKFDFNDLSAGEYALLVVSPKHTHCFKTVIKQFTVAKTENMNLPVTMLQLDNNRCTVIVN